MPLIFVVLLMAAELAGFEAQSMQRLSGQARIIDGDTFHVEDQRIRIFGIDAPEMAQKCPVGPPDYFDCGHLAAFALSELIRGREVRCRVRAHDDGDRAISPCEVGNIDVGEAMVLWGVAMAFTRAGDDDIAQEADARAHGRGFWETDWQRAWEYRAERWSVAEQTAPDGCPINGKISSDDERIYRRGSIIAKACTLFRADRRMPLYCPASEVVMICLCVSEVSTVTRATAREPVADRPCFVGGAVVQHQLDVEAGWNVGLDVPPEGQELPRAMAAEAASDHTCRSPSRELRRASSCRGGCRRGGADRAGRDAWQYRLRAIEGLHLALLVTHRTSVR